MLSMGTQPLPDGDRRAGWCQALLGEATFGQGGEEGARLGVQPVVVRQDCVEPIRQTPVMAGIPAGSTVDRLGVHVALDPGKVTQEIAKGEAAWCRRPLEIGRWNQYRDSAGAGVNAVEIAKEGEKILSGIHVKRR